MTSEVLANDSSVFADVPEVNLWGWLLGSTWKPLESKRRLTVSPPVSNNKRRSKLENKREEGW
jgi:hypothetical protein